MFEYVDTRAVVGTKLTTWVLATQDPRIQTGSHGVGVILVHLESFPGLYHRQE